jgi:hypothetical protein
MGNRQASQTASRETLDKELPFAAEDLSLLASGGFGVVFSGLHKVTQEPLVVKIARMTRSEDDNEDLWEAFTTELVFYETRSGRADISLLPAFYGSGMIKHEGVPCPWQVFNY